MIRSNFRGLGFALVALCLVFMGVNSAWAQAPDPDLNNDGTVTGQDVKIVATCLGKNGPRNPNCQIELADADGDGDVDGDDLQFVVKRLGESGFPIGNNNAPVADAGPDQSSSVLAGDVVVLDGSASDDPDGDPLTYNWSLVTVPAGSLAELSDPSVVDPSFVADLPGTYTAALQVNDGFVDGAPDEVFITVVIPAPVVSITAPESISVVTATPVTVTGTVDDPNATVTVNGVPVANTGGSYTADVALREGGNTVVVAAHNSTGDGRASVEVILNTSANPALSITSPGSDFLFGVETDVGTPPPFPAALVNVRGVIKVNTSAIFPNLNKPTVTVNGVAVDPAAVVLNLFFSDCGLFNPFQCWRFSGTIALDQGSRTITAIATDQDNRSTIATIGGTVDMCRAVWKTGSEPPVGGEDPGVLALAGLNHEVQNNRCHEIDGCSLGSGQRDDNPTPLAVCNFASTEFGRGTSPPSEFFVHGLKSRFDRPCNNHDVCYQTCVPVAGLSEAAKEDAWKAAMFNCNQQQYAETLEVCRRAYPAAICPVLQLSGACVLAGGCLKYQQERAFCFATALAYKAGVDLFGFNAFKERQEDYCAK